MATLSDLGRRLTPLTEPEQELVGSWSAPDSWQPGVRHPGRGKYLIKTGERFSLCLPIGIPTGARLHAVVNESQTRELCDHLAAIARQRAVLVATHAIAELGPLALRTVELAA